MHRITAAEKPQDLRSASWRLRKASGVVQSKADGLRTRGADDINPSTGQDQMRCPSSSSEGRKKWQIPPSSAFCSMEALGGLVILSLIGGCNVLY